MLSLLCSAIVGSRPIVIMMAVHRCCDVGGGRLGINTVTYCQGFSARKYGAQCSLWGILPLCFRVTSRGG